MGILYYFCGFSSLKLFQNERGLGEGGAYFCLFVCFKTKPAWLPQPSEMEPAKNPTSLWAPTWGFILSHVSLFPSSASDLCQVLCRVLR